MWKIVREHVVKWTSALVLERSLFLFLSLTLTLSLLLSRKTEERLRFTKSLILSSKISHQTQGIREGPSQPPFLPIFSIGILGRNDLRECDYGRPLLSSQAPSPQPCQKNISYMFYIQVGMKNKKYFLAIFSRFITIFFGTRGSRDCDAEGGEKAEGRGTGFGSEVDSRTGMFRFSREKGGTKKKKDRFRKAREKM